jgi:hypothetical protein
LRRACSRHWREEECRDGFCGKIRKKRPLGRLEVDERIGLKCVIDKWDGGVWTGFI